MFLPAHPISEKIRNVIEESEWGYSRLWQKRRKENTHRISTVSNSMPNTLHSRCINGYTSSISKFLSFSVSVNVELTNTRTKRDWIESWGEEKGKRMWDPVVVLFLLFRIIVVPWIYLEELLCTLHLLLLSSFFVFSAQPTLLHAVSLPCQQSFRV